MTTEADRRQFIHAGLAPGALDMQSASVLPG